MGGVPSREPDVAVCAVLLALFAAGAAANMAVFQHNRRRRGRRRRKFVFSALVFGFCMARVVALAARIAWARAPGDARVALASTVLTAAGVLVLLVTNLAFAQRILRAYHPLFGWRPWVGRCFWAAFLSAGGVLVTVVTVTVQSWFVEPPDRDGVRAADRRAQLFCAVFLAAYAFLPVPLVVGAWLAPRRTRIDKFGEGHFRTKVVLLTAAAALLAAGAVFRAAAAFAVRPASDPAWFHGRACFYCFNFGLELVVVFAYTLARFDKRFHVPDGSSAPGHYSCTDFGPEVAAVAGGAAAGAAAASSSSTGELHRMKRAYLSGGKRRGDAAWATDPAIMCNSSERSGGSGGARSARSARSSFGEGPSVRDSFMRDADLAWMARAMVCSFSWGHLASSYQSDLLTVLLWGVHSASYMAATTTTTRTKKSRAICRWVVALI